MNTEKINKIYCNMFNKYCYSLSNNNLHIENSYKIKTRKDMNYVLDDIKERNVTYDVIRYRSNESLIREWAAHNLLYELGLFKSHTKDVDLNYPQSKIVSFIYHVLSYIYFLKYGN